jgi:hypothetical protein
VNPPVRIGVNGGQLGITLRMYGPVYDDEPASAGDSAQSITAATFEFMAPSLKP